MRPPRPPPPPPPPLNPPLNTTFFNKAHNKCSVKLYSLTPLLSYKSAVVAQNSTEFEKKKIDLYSRLFQRLCTFIGVIRTRWPCPRALHREYTHAWVGFQSLYILSLLPYRAEDFGRAVRVAIRAASLSRHLMASSPQQL